MRGREKTRTVSFRLYQSDIDKIVGFGVRAGLPNYGQTGKVNVSLALRKIIEEVKV